MGHIPDTSVILQKNDVGHVPNTSVLQKKKNRKNDVGHVPDTSVLQKTNKQTNKKIEKMTWVMYPTRHISLSEFEHSQM